LQKILAVLVLLSLWSGASLSCGGTGASSSQGESAAVQVGAKSEPPKRTVDYMVVDKSASDDGGRKRLIAKVVVPANLDSDQALAATRAAIEELLPANGSVQAVEVLVYRDKSETGGDFTYALGFAALDGKGWDGSGWFVITGGKKVSDRSNIELDMKNGSSVDHYSLAR
jgi:hypothetical protein